MGHTPIKSLRFQFSIQILFLIFIDFKNRRSHLKAGTTMTRKAQAHAAAPAHVRSARRVANVKQVSARIAGANGDPFYVGSSACAAHVSGRRRGARDCSHWRARWFHAYARDFPVLSCSVRPSFRPSSICAARRSYEYINRSGIDLSHK